MKTEKIECDNCNKDLTYSNNGFRMCLRIERIPTSPLHYDWINETAAFRQEKHYCNVNCAISHLNENKLKP